MDSLTTYKLQRQLQPNPLPPPPYCKKFEHDEPESPKVKGLDVSDPGKILLLVESLYHSNTHELEKKLNHYVSS